MVWFLTCVSLCMFRSFSVCVRVRARVHVCVLAASKILYFNASVKHQIFTTTAIHFLRESWLRARLRWLHPASHPVKEGKRVDSPHSRRTVLWCKGCCHRTSPHHLIPGTEVLCRNFLTTHRTRLLTDDRCRWNFAEQRQSAVSGTSFAPY